MSETQERRQLSIGETTTIRVSLIVVLAGFLVGTVWWAATLQTKVDTLLNNTTKYDSTAGSHAAQITDLNSRVNLMDQLGTKKGQETEKEITSLIKRIIILETRLPKLP